MSEPHKTTGGGVPVAVLMGVVLLTACSASMRRQPGPRQYEQTTDSVTASCTRGSANCAAMFPEKALRTQVPAPRTGPRVPPLLSKSDDSDPLAPSLKLRIEAVLQECADMALIEGLRQHRNGRVPTKQECTQVVRIERSGTAGGSRRRVEITLAMELGNTMHALADACAEEKLKSILPPSRFAVQMTYRRNPENGSTEWLDKAMVKDTMKKWYSREGTGQEHPLLGSIRPDVVIHQGDPLRAQAIYDFKFPCGDSGETGWRRHTDGPHEGKTQKDVYEEFSEPAPAMRVLPGKRILP